MPNIFLLKSLFKWLLVVRDLTSVSIVCLVGEQTDHLIFVNSFFVFLFLFSFGFWLWVMQIKVSFPTTPASGERHTGAE